MDGTMDLEIWLEMWNGQRFSTLAPNGEPKCCLFLSRLFLTTRGFCCRLYFVRRCYIRVVPFPLRPLNRT